MRSPRQRSRRIPPARARHTQRSKRDRRSRGGSWPGYPCGTDSRGAGKLPRRGPPLSASRQSGGVSVIDDYGHHPTEIRATLAAARQCGFRKIHVIFQPHRYTRTHDLMNEFATAFEDADSLFVLDIYAASEQPIAGVTGGGSGAKNQRSRKSVGNLRFIVCRCRGLGNRCGPGRRHDPDAGCGQRSQVGPMILEKLQGKEPITTWVRRFLLGVPPI